MSEDSISPVEAYVDFYENKKCRETCKGMLASTDKLIKGGWIKTNYEQKGEVVACIDLESCSYEGYLSKVKKLYKGNSIREARKSSELGYFCKEFPRMLYIPDIVDINSSMPIRSGMPISAHYLKSIQELGGYPTSNITLAPPLCATHAQTHYGVFVPEPEHKQGEIKVDARLVGYIIMNRYGNFCNYSIIIGHGDHLKNYIMSLLHLYVMEDILSSGQPKHQGLKYLVYHKFITENPGLTFWKKKFGFIPANLILENNNLL